MLSKKPPEIENTKNVANQVNSTYVDSVNIIPLDIIKILQIQEFYSN